MLFRLQMKDESRSRLVVSAVRAAAAGLLLILSTPVFLNAQEASVPVALPARAPGYEHYFHPEQPATAFATRWGYHDGYDDGKRDRTEGKPSVPTDQDRYKLVPDHGYHPDIPRAKYKTLYRSAYMDGYEYAFKF